MAAALSAKDLAEKLGTDAKTVRRFLRKREMGVGQGNRYEIDPKSVTRLKRDFEKWAKEEADKKAKREQEKSRKSDTKAESVPDDVIAEETHEDNDAEPTDSDIEDIEDETPEV
jgi:hypothetical protein